MNNILTLHLDALPEHPELSETISFQLSGLVVVFLVLGSIWFLLEIIGKIFVLRDKVPAKTTTIVCPGASAPAAGPEPAAPAATVTATSPAVAETEAQVQAQAQAANDDTISAETVALIAAAVHLTVGSGHRILSISPVAPNPHWALEGRRQIFASHRPR